MNTIPHQLEDTVEQESKLKPKLPKNYKVILLERRLYSYGICSRCYTKSI